MSDGGALVEIGKLAEPVTELIRQVGNAIGAVYEPTRLRRLARAEVDVAKLLLESKLALSAIEQRGLERLVHQEGKRQQNIEAIVDGAVKLLPDDKPVKEIDPDWLTHFFEHCAGVSNSTMQTLWSRLLSSEATAPGSFSRRTVAVVSSMDPVDATMFQTACRYLWTLEEDDINMLLPGEFPSGPAKRGLAFWEANHLQAIGLLTLATTSVFSIPVTEPPKSWAFYFGQRYEILIEPPPKEKFKLDAPMLTAARQGGLPVGPVLLTQVGRELAALCQSEPDQEYLESLIAELRSYGVQFTRTAT